MTGANEKYIGDAVLQKTFKEDLFDRKQVKNQGQLPKYYVYDTHPAIIDRASFQRAQEELARRSSLRRTSSRAKTELGKYCGKYALSELLVCSECGSPYRRVTWMPNGEKRFVWRCINRLEHGKRVCKCSATLEEPDIHAAVTAALNERIRQRAAREALADCVAAALAGTEGGDSLPAVEAKLRALQARQMELLEMALNDAKNTGFDDELVRINEAMSGLLTRKNGLLQAGCTDPEHDSRVRSIAARLEKTDSALEGFDQTVVRQLVGSIRVLDRDRLLIRFKDGAEAEQAVEHASKRASA